MPKRRATNAGRAARSLGRRGERIARRALRRAGLRVLARNVRTPHGEIDLLALDGRVLVAVEVKSTQRPRLGARVLRDAQRARIERALAWIARRTSPRPERQRLDLVEVVVRGWRADVRVRRGAPRRRGRRGRPCFDRRRIEE